MRQCTYRYYSEAGSFNPRICKRCDASKICSVLIPSVVSIHASVKDATSLSPHSPVSLFVSIHASVKDATYAFRVRFCCVFVSIHASVKDATFSVYSACALVNCFNPRICKRCDVKLVSCVLFTRIVSIHASVKDATLRCVVSSISVMFQSTHL